MITLDTFLATPWLLYFTVTLVSLCIGSFLNVVILRLPKMMQQDWRCQCEEFLEVPEKQRKQEDRITLAKPAPRAVTASAPGKTSRWSATWCSGAGAPPAKRRFPRDTR